LAKRKGRCIECGRAVAVSSDREPVFLSHDRQVGMICGGTGLSVPIQALIPVQKVKSRTAVPAKKPSAVAAKSEGISGAERDAIRRSQAEERRWRQAQRQEDGRGSWREVSGGLPTLGRRR
jgi:hypothetical protein